MSKQLEDRLDKMEETNRTLLDKLDLIVEEIDYLNRNAFNEGNGNIEYREI